MPNLRPDPRRRPIVAGMTAVVLALATVTGTLAQGASVEVEPSNGLPAGPATLSISGTGFSTAGNGIYVVFGPITPAPAYYTDPSIYGAFTWVHAGSGGSPIEAPLAEDGSFAITLNITSAFATSAGDVDCTLTACAVITFAAHGSPDRSQDTCTAITFVSPGIAPTDGAPPASTPPASASPASMSAVPSASAAPTSEDPCSSIGAPQP